MLFEIHRGNKTPVGHCQLEQARDAFARDGWSFRSPEAGFWRTATFEAWSRHLNRTSTRGRGLEHAVRVLPFAHEHSSSLAHFLKRHFEATKLLRAQFRKQSFHLPGMLSEGRHNEVLTAWGQGNHPNAPILGAFDPADQALREEAVDRDTDRT